MDYQASLTQSGLTKDQASIYEVLVKHGTMPASRISRLSPVSRTLTYKVLGELIALGLVEKREDSGKVAVFAPAHPLKLRELIERKRTEVQDATQAVEGIFGKLLSDFNLTVGKPGVQYFEGDAGMRAIIEDSLESKTEIYSYIDIDVIEREMGAISRDFGEKRKRRGIKKKNIAIDTPENRKLVDAEYLSDITEERLIPWPTPAFGATMQIYDDKISYLTFGAQKIGIIVTDPLIAHMHRTLFELTWNHPKAYTPSYRSAETRDSLDGSKTA